MFAICFYYPSLAQYKISGKVLNENKEPVSNSTVILLDSSKKIIKYNFTNTDGNYFFIIDSSIIKGYFIQISHVNYIPVEIPLKNANGHYTTELKPSHQELPEVVIKDAPFIVQKNDTINYTVKKFSSQGDITIGDVLKKLPGITINKNGQISYNGTAINKFYIEGDDLLGQQYNIAETVIPFDVVDQVQVYENHQPIKTLEGIEETNRPALNLKLNKRAKSKIFGTGAVETRLPGLSSHAELNTLLFKKKFQSLNKFAYDANGNDLSFDVEKHSIKDFLASTEKDFLPELTIKNASEPPLDKNRRWLNNSGIITSNILFHTNLNNTVKINTYYLAEKAKENYFSSDQIFLSKDSSIKHIENQGLHEKGNRFYSQLNFLSNKKSHYLENNLEFEIRTPDTKATTAYEAGGMQQRLRSHGSRVENNFTWMKPLSSKFLIQFSQLTGYFSIPENLWVFPGLPLGGFTEGDFNETQQEFKKKSFYSNTKINADILTPNLGYNFEAGVKFNQNKYRTSLLLKQNDTVKETGNEFTNNAEYQFWKIYFQSTVRYSKNKINTTFSIPISYNSVSFYEVLNNKKLLKTPFFINPFIDIKWFVSPVNIFLLRYSFDHSFGNSADLLPGFVLSNYRVLNLNINTLFKELKDQKISLSYTVKKPLQGFFASLIAVASNNKNNIITNQNYQPSGLTLMEQFALANQRRTYLMSGVLSKYFFKSLTSVKLSVNLSISNAPLMQNHLYSVVNNISKSATFFMSSKAIKSVEMENEFNIILSDFRQKTIGSALSTGKNSIISDMANVIFYLSPKWQINYTLEWNHINGGTIKSNYFLNDLNIGYSFTKTKNKLSIGCYNLFNKQTYLLRQISANSISGSGWKLRPREFYAKFYFRF